MAAVSGGSLAQLREQAPRLLKKYRLPLLIFLEFWQPQFLANLVIADAQFLNLLVRHMHFFAGFKIDTVDNTV